LLCLLVLNLLGFSKCKWDHKVWPINNSTGDILVDVLGITQLEKRKHEILSCTEPSDILKPFLKLKSELHVQRVHLMMGDMAELLYDVYHLNDKIEQTHLK